MLPNSRNTVARSGSRRGNFVRHSSFVLCVLGAALAACTCGSAVTRTQQASPVPATARWVLLPFANYSEAPQSAERVEAMTETLLRMRGLSRLVTYAAQPADDRKDLRAALVADGQRDATRAIAWAKAQGFVYGVSGSVEEWRYKSGLEAEPAVGISVRVTDLSNDKVIWSASGTDTGPAHEAVSGTALRLMDRLLSGLEFR